MDIHHIDRFLGLACHPDLAELLDQLREPVFTVRDTGYDYRQINHWDEEGILEASRDARNWRKFDFIQFVWLKIVGEFREMGLPIGMIGKVKAELWQEVSWKVAWAAFMQDPGLLAELVPDEAEAIAFHAWMREQESYLTDLGFPVLAGLIVEAVRMQQPLSIKAFRDGQVLVCDPAMHEESAAPRNAETHITVSLSRIIEDYLLQGSDVFAIQQTRTISPEEARLLEILRSGSYQSATVNFRKDQIHSVELSQVQEAGSKLTNVLSGHPYQDIVIKTHKGKVTRIENTIKIRLDK